MSTPTNNEECIVAMYDSFAKTVLRNKCRKLMKSKKRRNEHETVGTAKMQYLFEREPYHDVYPSEQLVFCGDEYACIIGNETLYQAMMLLKEEERAILVLDFWYELSDEEIAKKFHITVRTVYNRRQRAFKTIKSYYEKMNEKLTLKIICAAVRGELEAQSFILNYYENYINALVTGVQIAGSGENFYQADEDIKIQIQQHLLEATKKWKVVER